MKVPFRDASPDAFITDRNDSRTLREECKVQPAPVALLSTAVERGFFA